MRVTDVYKRQIVNELVILPDIEKRLEAFVRVGHGIIIFPGGAGTAEEFLYLLGILTHPDNRDLPFPVILTGPKSAGPYPVSYTHLHRAYGWRSPTRCRTRPAD